MRRFYDTILEDVEKPTPQGPSYMTDPRMRAKMYGVNSDVPQEQVEEETPQGPSYMTDPRMRAKMYGVNSDVPQEQVEEPTSQGPSYMTDPRMRAKMYGVNSDVPQEQEDEETPQGPSENVSKENLTVSQTTPEESQEVETEQQQDSIPMYDKIYEELYPKPVYDEAKERRLRNQAGIKNAFSLLGNLIASKYTKPTHQDIDPETEIAKEKTKYEQLLDKYRTSRFNLLKAEQDRVSKERIEKIKADNAQKKLDQDWEKFINREEGLNERNQNSITSREKIAGINSDTRRYTTDQNNKRARDIAEANAKRQAEAREANLNKTHMTIKYSGADGTTQERNLTQSDVRALKGYLLNRVPKGDKPLGEMNSGGASDEWVATIADKYPELIEGYFEGKEVTVEDNSPQIDDTTRASLDAITQQMGNPDFNDPNYQRALWEASGRNMELTRKYIREKYGR